MNLVVAGEITPFIRKWKPYPGYKDSGVEWLGDIPIDWKLKKLKYLFQVVNGSTPQSGEPDYWGGDIAWATPDDMGSLSSAELTETAKYITRAGYESCGTTLVPKGSLVLSTRAPIGHLALARVSLCTNQGCRSLVFRKDYHRKFYYYLLIAARPELESLGQGSTFRELSKTKLEATALVLPPDLEQHAIADFLDRETAKIDALVAKKERLIELLQEKRAALITRAVTRGLDPNAPMKDSGVEWLGEIPAHWEVKKVKHLAKVVSKGTTPTTIGSEFLDQGIRFIKAENIDNGRIFDEPATFIDSATDELLRRSRLESQDVLMVIAGATTGKVGIVNATQTPANTNQAVAFIRLENATISRFLFYWLTGRKIQEQVWLKAVQAAQPNLSLDDISNFIVPLPTAVEIELLEKYLDAEAAKLDALIAKIRDGIEKLKEYRTALISAAVTGKIDVREGLADSTHAEAGVNMD